MENYRLVHFFKGETQSTRWQLKSDHQLRCLIAMQFCHWIHAHAHMCWLCVDCAAHISNNTCVKQNFAPLLTVIDLQIFELTVVHEKIYAWCIENQFQLTSGIYVAVGVYANSSFENKFWIVEHQKKKHKPFRAFWRYRFQCHADAWCHWHSMYRKKIFWIYVSQEKYKMFVEIKIEMTSGIGVPLYNYKIFGWTHFHMGGVWNPINRSNLTI